jgi:hypothetical protein
MAMEVVRSKQTGSASAATLAITAPSVGHLLVVFIDQSGTTAAPTGKDLLGTTGWTVNATHGVYAASVNSLYVATKVAVGTESELTPSAGAGGTVQGLSYFEVSGASGTVDAIVHADNAINVKTLASPGLTTTDAGSVVLGAAAMGKGSGTVSAWTGTGPMTNVETVTTRCLGGSYIPGSTISGATFTANWEVAANATLLVVAIKPLGEETKKGSGSLSVGGDLAGTQGPTTRKGPGNPSLSGPRIVGTQGPTTRAGLGVLSVGARIQGTPVPSGETKKGSGSLSAGGRLAASGVSRRSTPGSLSAGASQSATARSVRSGQGALSAGPRTNAIQGFAIPFMVPFSLGTQTPGFTTRKGTAAASTGARLSATGVSTRRGIGQPPSGARISSTYSTKRKGSGSSSTGARLSATLPAKALRVGRLSVGARFSASGRAFMREPPTGTPLAGHVTVGRTGRLARSTGRITTTNSGRARR